MKVGYAKLGRSFPLALGWASSVGGDVEVIRLLRLLARDHEVHLVGRNQCDDTITNVVNHWAAGAAYGNVKIVADHQRYPDDPDYLDFLHELDVAVDALPPLDAYVVWLGQHGTAASFIPSVGEDKKEVDGRVPRGTTRPLMSLINYVYPVVHLLNRRGIKPIWLCPDPRNKLKARDLAEPNQRPVLAQYNCTRDNLFFNRDDQQTRSGTVRYVYSGIELLALDPAGRAPERVPSLPLGMLVNEGYSNLGEKGRLALLQRWCGSMEYELVGHWSLESQRALGRAVGTVPVADVARTLGRWRATITLPATNSGWATAKPWECFDAGVVCFRHPKYDDQNHIYGEHMPQTLREFLSPSSPQVFQSRVQYLVENEELWRNTVAAQHSYLRESLVRLRNGASEVERAIQLVGQEGPR